MNELSHYWSCALQVIFRIENPDNAQADVSSMFVSTILISDRQLVGAHELARIQQRAQLTTVERMSGVEIKILDVVVLSISYLGQATHDEFMAMKNAPAEDKIPEPAGNA